MLQKALYGSMMGTALGDSMGLPYEGLSRSKIAKKKYSFEKQHLILGKGLFSDDTEQTLSLAQSLIESYDNIEKFEWGMKRRLKFWLLGLPAGVGMATSRAILKSFFVKKSGVFSAGNAPAMRSAIVGILFGHNPIQLKEFVKINTELTHTDPKAYYGALAVAQASYLASINQENTFFTQMKHLVTDKEFLALLDDVQENLELNTLEFTQHLGLEKGVSGYIYHTLPIVLHTWLRNKNNLQQAIIDVIRCGGDTDTTGAIVGSIIGAKGEDLPQKWIEGIVDFPRNITFIQKTSLKLAQTFEKKEPQKAPFLSPFWIILRNILFLLIVLIVAIIR